MRSSLLSKRRLGLESKKQGIELSDRRPRKACSSADLLPL
jgi:hypothetical protein